MATGRKDEDNMEIEEILFLQYRDNALSYAIQYSERVSHTEQEILLQAERFFNFIVGDKPKKKKARVVKLVKE